MPIGEVIRILKAFQRYVDHINGHGQDDVIDSIKGNNSSLIITMKGHMGETYLLEVWISNKNNELCIVNDNDESVFDIIDYEEYGLTDKIVNNIKYGRNE